MEAVKLSDVRVVIVDRDVENVMKLRWMFEGCGYENVACVETAEDALWFLRNSCVDILLCEIHDGGRGGGGFQVISAIRQEFTCLQVVLFSSDDDDDDVMGEMAVRALEVGACAFYSKAMISMEVVQNLWLLKKMESSCSSINEDIIMTERPNSEHVKAAKKRKRGDDEEMMMSSSSSSSGGGELCIRSGFINISNRIMGAASKKKNNRLLIMLNNNNTTAGSDHQEQAELEDMIFMMTPPTANSDSADSNSSPHYDHDYNTVMQDYWSAAASAAEDSSMLQQDYWSDADIEELMILNNIPQLLHLSF